VLCFVNNGKTQHRASEPGLDGWMGATDKLMLGRVVSGGHCKRCVARGPHRARVDMDLNPPTGGSVGHAYNLGHPVRETQCFLFFFSALCPIIVVFSFKFFLFVLL